MLEERQNTSASNRKQAQRRPARGFSAALILLVAAAVSIFATSTLAQQQQPPETAKTPEKSVEIVAPPAEQLPLGQSADGSILNQNGGEPASGVGGDFNAMMLQTLGALGLVLAAIFATRAVVMRTRGRQLRGRFSQQSTGAKLELIDQLGIGPGRQVLLIRAADRLLVVGDSQAGLQTLSEFESTEANAVQSELNVTQVGDASAPTATTAADIDSLLAGLRERRSAAKQGVSE